MLYEARWGLSQTCERGRILFIGHNIDLYKRVRRGESIALMQIVIFQAVLTWKLYPSTMRGLEGEKDMYRFLSTLGILDWVRLGWVG